ncbi:MAG: glycerol-3-phosphate 1-O-acyltransferase PlsY [Verrucomicrobiae bacterium]|nr:glycerol-3-phosphate 1-O-acyltransferase PlsY [Verrucomicrobiae bacterium]MCX7723387.1 glycerol-3-phosphate 1-O-acyltransferase PlsY [Verrucomicrobiae bacterium]MDW7979905.1 glycerol-3-phosphate 1-O-acyltransferase PlsY [Verrucomicrobiales bacterium]
MDAICAIAVCVAGYLLGSVPTGYLVGRAKGVDLRNVGSGNIGATNAMRVLGKPIGVAVLIVDALKGYLACTVVTGAVLGLRGIELAHAEPYRVVAGAAAVVGHSFTCWLRFRGGKGVATGAGVFAALAPGALAVAAVAWVIVLALTRYVSMASIVAALALAAGVWLGAASPLLRAVATAVALLVVLRHSSNIKRLLAGTEHKFGQA